MDLSEAEKSIDFGHEIVARKDDHPKPKNNGRKRVLKEPEELKNEKIVTVDSMVNGTGQNGIHQINENGQQAPK